MNILIITKSLIRNGNERISEHFTVKETGSTSPNPYNIIKTYSDQTKYDTVLVDMLEKLIKSMGAETAIVSSWYRTPAHDKAVGGNGRGQHCSGKAVDIAFRKNGKFIDTKIISCIAQDLGFKGIARISQNYIHLDMRDYGTYFGDEMAGHTRTVTNDFRKYYNVSELEIKDVLIKQDKIIDEEIKTSYFPKYEGISTSIVDILDDIKVNSSFSYRSKIANANNIKNYTGTILQNNKIVELIKSGKLIKP